MKLYDYFRSSAAYRVRIALGIKGLAAERQYINLREGQQRSVVYLMENPAGLIPALDVNGQVLSESLAIMEYLEETHPDPAILPDNPLDRAYVRGLAQMVACDIHPINNLRVLNYLGDALGADQDKKDEWYRHWVETGFAAIEAILAKDPRVDIYCYGSRPTMADICLVPQVFNAERFNVDMTPFPTIARIAKACNTLAVFQQAHPSKQKDAVHSV